MADAEGLRRGLPPLDRRPAPGAVALDGEPPPLLLPADGDRDPAGGAGPGARAPRRPRLLPGPPAESRLAAAAGRPALLAAAAGGDPWGV